MTSLTRELNNPQSPIYQWFDSKQSSSGDHLIRNHNAQMNRNQIIKPQGQIKDFALLGTGFILNFGRAIVSYFAHWL